MSLEDIRRRKMQQWPQNYSFQINSYCNISERIESETVSIAGRIVFFRDLGKIVFGKLKDFTGIAQFSLTEAHINDFKMMKNLLDLGDIIGITGQLYKTQAGEITIQVTDLRPLRKALLPLPDKFKGIQDEELKIRYRYLDIISDNKTQEIFKIRFKIINTIRNFLTKRDFIEVETPILQPIASGAAANPFKTFHDSLKIEMYLRIAPELYLKRLLVAGMNRVFEIAKNFRNEGLDPTHLQEFTMLEYYQAYVSYEDLMSTAIELLQEIASCVEPMKKIGDMDFNTIPKMTYVEFLRHYGDLDFARFDDDHYINQIAQKHHIDISKYKSRYAIIDAIYKHCCVKKIVSPVLVYNYPRHPLAKIDTEDPRFSNKFQIILNKQEVVNAFLELNDPDIQEQNFNEQKLMNDGGEDDVVRTDDDFVEALKFGMPPAGGVGLGIDRIITIMTQSSTIRDVVFFPQVKSKK